MLRFLRRTRRETQPPPKVAPGDRIYAIGDIHGRADLLDQLLERIEADSRTHADGRTTTIIALGDYVDRGENSRAVLDRIGSLIADGAIALRGNHEDALLDFLEDPETGADWLGFGGLQTLASYGVAPPRRNRADLQRAAVALTSGMGRHVGLLRDRLSMFHQSGDVVFVHADLEPDVALVDQDERVMMWGLSSRAGGAWRRGSLLVHGHYASDAPVESEGRICVDTGAFYTNTLTCVRLDDGVAYLHT